jgi:hypothetical protein
MSQIRTDSIVPAGGIPAGASGGGIIQVVQTVKTDAFTTNSGNGVFVDLTGLSVTITPRSASNKILVSYSVQGCEPNNAGTHTKLQRNSSDILLGDAASGETRCTTGGFFRASGNNEVSTHYIQYVDSPSTTSAVTYKIVCSGGGGTLTVNRSSNTGLVYNPRCVSIITAMEVSG